MRVITIVRQFAEANGHDFRSLLKSALRETGLKPKTTLYGEDAEAFARLLRGLSI